MVAVADFSGMVIAARRWCASITVRRAHMAAQPVIGTTGVASAAHADSPSRMASASRIGATEIIPFASIDAAHF
jgi:hypothetical protein